MTKSELIYRMAARYPSLRLADMEAALDTVLEQIAACLQFGGRVEIRGFGSFICKERAARLGRNPRTGESVDVVGKRMPLFKAGRSIQRRLNAPSFPEAAGTE